MTKVGIVSSTGETIEYPASLVGTDAQHDIAVLLVDAPEHDFRPVQVGTSADLRTGQSVYAIGNPLGYSKTLTAGVVSGVNRAIPSPVGTKTYGAIQVQQHACVINAVGAQLHFCPKMCALNRTCSELV